MSFKLIDSAEHEVIVSVLDSAIVRIDWNVELSTKISGFDTYGNGRTEFNDKQKIKQII